MHNVISTSPFEVYLRFLSKRPLAMLGLNTKTTTRKEVDVHGQVVRFIDHIQKILDHVREALQKSQQKHKARHAQHCTDHQFRIGDKD
jgi:hypothetical protein